MPSNQRLFLDNLARQLNITDQHGWYNLTITALREHGGHALLQKYKGSVCKMLSTVYPEYLKNCRDAVMQVVHDLKLEKVQDLLSVSSRYQQKDSKSCSFSLGNDFVVS